MHVTRKLVEVARAEYIYGVCDTINSTYTYILLAMYFLLASTSCMYCATANCYIHRCADVYVHLMYVHTAHGCTCTRTLMSTAGVMECGRQYPSKLHNVSSSSESCPTPLPLSRISRFTIPLLVEIVDTFDISRIGEEVVFWASDIVDKSIDCRSTFLMSLNLIR